VLIGPLMPGINDSPEQVGEVLRLASEAGADYVAGIPLHLRRGVREVFMSWLADSRPEQVARYEELYRRSAYLRPSEVVRLERMVGSGGPRRLERSARETQPSPDPRAKADAPREEVPAPRLF
jgi:DNA repair photolyase